jgi:soluble lytic murein transglycosylase-like protein
MLDTIPLEPPTEPPTVVLRAGLMPGRHTPPSFECFIREADRHDIDPFVLLAVLKTENGRPGEVAQNANGTQDLGIMSINTVWLQDFARKYRLTEDAAKRKLASDGCANVAAGAWILGQRIAEANGNIWEGVARYHSRTPSKQIPYLKRVKARLQETLARMRSLEP